MRFSLRAILTLVLLLITALPVLMFGYWAQKSTLEREHARVKESHLLIAENMTLALNRYAIDLKAVFAVIGGLQGNITKYETALAAGLHFVDFQILSDSGVFESKRVFCCGEPESRFTVPTNVIQGALNSTFEDEISFHPVTLSRQGVPRLYLSVRMADSSIAISSVALDYFRTLQSSVKFGSSGHSAIVDQAGSLMAHPLVEWVAENKNLSTLEPIREMMQGKSGVTEFFSPATKSIMISGFAVVPEVGWGVMVPQKLSDLKSFADSLLHQLWYVLIAGLIASTLVAWFLAGLMIKPLNRITETANRMNAGDLSARVLPFLQVPAKEFKILGLAFDKMAQSLQNTNAKLKIKLSAQELTDLSGETKETKSRGKVLIIDDSIELVQAITGWLSKAGYTTYSALEHEEALKIAAVMRPDISLVGVRSAVDGGYHEKRQLINLLHGVDIPVIALLPEDVDLARFKRKETNVIASLEAPIGEQKLLELIDNVSQTKDWKILGVSFS